MMMGVIFDQPAKTRIGIVRVLFKGENPFVQHLSDDALLKLLESMQVNIQTAARHLSEIAKIELPDLSKTEKQLQVEQLLKRSREKPFEIVLSEEFMNRSARTHNAVRELEKLETESRPYDQNLANSAMEGLKSVLDFTRAVPDVYDALKPTPMGAVA